MSQSPSRKRTSLMPMADTKMYKLRIPVSNSTEYRTSHDIRAVQLRWLPMNVGGSPTHPNAEEYATDRRHEC